MSVDATAMFPPRSVVLMVWSLAARSMVLHLRGGGGDDPEPRVVRGMPWTPGGFLRTPALPQVPLDGRPDFDLLIRREINDDSVA